jgi:hypothetical protein
MSLLLATITSERALVAVDTAASEARSGASPAVRATSKMFALPHANAIVAAVGNMHFGMSVLEHANLLPSFDGICNALIGGLMDEVSRHVDAVAARHRFEVREQQLAVFAGWSPALQRMRGMRLHRATLAAGFAVHEFDYVISPHFAPIPDLAPPSVDAMVDIARIQVSEVRRTVPQCPIGGRLLLATLTRDAMTIRSVAELGLNGSAAPGSERQEGER